MKLSSPIHPVHGRLGYELFKTKEKEPLRSMRQNCYSYRSIALREALILRNIGVK